MHSPAGAALAGSLLGQALGDALGFVVEAAPPDVAAAYVESCLLAGGAGSRSHHAFPFGQYSDDTQLAREILRSVVAAGGWDPAAFAQGVAALFRDGHDVGAGPGTRSAAERLLRGVSWRDSGRPAPYAGNGSAMRAAPLGILFRDDTARMVRATREQSLITHRDPRCAAGAIAVAGAAALASSVERVVPDEFLGRLAAWAGEEDHSVADAILDIIQWLDLAPAEAAQRLHEAGLDVEHADSWRGISTFVTPSVVWSLYAFLRSPDDYWTTICTAIGVGGDTDTMAAMAGAISGARGGEEALPKPLLSALNDRGAWTAKDLARLAHESARIMVRPADASPS
jgi:ADP-ribosylglycohydrolase